MKWFTLAVAALLACVGPAAAQRTPTYQGGAIVPGDIAKFQANGPVTSAGNLLGDPTGRGVNPFSILDRNDLAVCMNNAVTGGAYNAFCLGHDTSGNALLTLDSYAGAGLKTFNCRINGVTIENCLSGGTVTGISIRPGTGLGSSPDPITTSGEIFLEDTAVTPGTYPYPTALAVDQQGRVTSITAGSAPTLPCTSPSGSLQYDNSGNFGCATVAAGLLFSDGVLSQTQTINNQSGGDYTVLTGDAAKTVLTGNHAYSLPQAGTTGFETGWSACFLNAGANGATITTTTSIFSGAGDGTSVTLNTGDWICPASDGSNWQTVAGFGYRSTTSGLPMIGGGAGARLTTGTRSGNTTQFATVTGSKTSGNLMSWDASGNAVDSGISSISVGGGDVSGPGTAVSGNIATFNGTTGKTIQDSGIAASGVLVSGGALGTPSSGNGSNLTSLNASNLSSGTVAAARGGAGTVNGIMKANGSGAVSAATSGTDYAPATSGSAILKGNGSGGFSSAVSGTDYAPATSGSAILKGNGSGGFSSAVSSTDYAPATSGSALLKGNGSGGFSSASAGTDYAAAPSGSASDILTSNGSGGFGTAITPASGIATFLATPSGTNLASALTSALTVGKGGTGLTSGTSGGVLGFTGSSTLASSGALTANMPVIGGGAGSTPTVGTVSGNTTQFVTTTGTQTSGRCVKIDANGNHVADSAACGTGTLTASTGVAAIGWVAGVSPDKLVVFTADTAMTITGVRGTVANAVGATAAIQPYKTASGTACSSGTALTTGTFNANGTAATNQTLTLAGSGAPSLSAGDRICLSTSDGTNFTAGSGNGGITFTYTVP